MNSSDKKTNAEAKTNVSSFYPHLNYGTKNYSDELKITVSDLTMIAESLASIYAVLARVTSNEPEQPQYKITATVASKEQAADWSDDALSTTNGPDLS